LAGLLFISIEESLKPLVWQEACTLIRKYGFRYKNNQSLEDLELTCLSLIIDIRNIQTNLCQEIEDVTNDEAIEAFSFLLTLVQNASDLRKPVWGFYRMFGSGPGKWHMGQFEDSIISASEKIFSTQEFDPRQRVCGILNEAIIIISDLYTFELINKVDSDHIISKLEKINMDLINPLKRINHNNAAIHNSLINTELLQNIWKYAQSEPKEIIKHIHSEIFSFNRDFSDYFINKKCKGHIIEDWSKGIPEIFINPLSSIETLDRYVFFKPFRDFIRDVIYNSIWVKHGIENEKKSKCSLSITLIENLDFLSIEFKNLTEKNSIQLFRRAYHTRIHALYGDFTTVISGRVYTVTLKIPATSKLLPNGGYNESLNY
jgi:hypothetical protein